MKKLLFVCNNLQIGGVQKALVNLLRQIAPCYEITLFLMAPAGPLLEELPEGVRVLRANRLARVLGLSQAQAREEGLLPWLWRGLLAVLTRVFTTRAVFALLSRLQPIPGEYDAAISYRQNEGERCFYGGCVELTLNAARARRRICFIHCDFEHYEGNCPYNIRMLARFDRVAAVSRSVAEGILRAAPQLEGKVVSVRNCYNRGQLLELARAYEVPRSPGAVNLFSAARLSPEKGLARMVPILGQIRDMGIPFVWRVAGKGPERAELEALIAQWGLEDRVILLGELANPYPFLQAADALLVPSFLEAAPMVFGEAQLLGVPVFTTATTSAEELVGRPNLGRVLPTEDSPLLQELARLLMDFPRLEFDRRPLDNRLAEEEFHALINYGREDGYGNPAGLMRHDGTD